MAQHMYLCYRSPRWKVIATGQIVGHYTDHPLKELEVHEESKEFWAGPYASLEEAKKALADSGVDYSYIREFN